MHRISIRLQIPEVTWPRALDLLCNEHIGSMAVRLQSIPCWHPSSAALKLRDCDATKPRKGGTSIVALGSRVGGVVVTVTRYTVHYNNLIASTRVTLEITSEVIII